MAFMLHIVAGPHAGAALTVPLEGRLAIGRDPTNDLTLADPSVAPRHCRLALCATGMSLEAFAPTFVNGLPLADPTISPGDSIEIGDTAIILRSADLPAGAGQVRISDATAAAVERTVRVEDLLEGWPRRPPALAEVEQLARIATALTTISGLAGLGRPWLELVLDALGAARGALLLLEGDTLTGLCGVNRLDPASPVLISRALVDRVLNETVALVATSHAEGRWAHDGRVMLVTPLRAFDRVLGVIYVETAAETPAAGDDQLRFLVAVSATAALALAHARHHERAETEALQQRAEDDRKYRMVGRSAPMRRLYRYIAKAAPTQSTILITGESGTGKELVARAIHRNSRRAHRPFATINCAAIPETLLESELFGHERGAFTGAVAQKRGRFEVADGGTLFLDEIGELSPTTQAKLLRVLQEGEIERLGGTTPIRVDFRLMAATNRDLEAAKGTGQFRPDLYFRLKVISLHVPPLRERREDIPALARYFAEKHGRGAGHAGVSITPAALSALTEYEWPGNIRELEHVIERAIVLGDGEVVHVHDLPDVVGDAAPVVEQSGHETFHAAVRARKKELILRAVERAGGNLTAAARVLDLHPNYLHRLIATLQLRPSIASRFPPPPHAAPARRRSNPIG